MFWDGMWSYLKDVFRGNEAVSHMFLHTYSVILSIGLCSILGSWFEKVLVRLLDVNKLLNTYKK